MVVGGDLSGPSFVVFDPWGAQGGEAKKGSNRANKLKKKMAKTEKPKIQETLHKSGPGLMFMGFW
jgi:hypothetical protein